MRFHDQDDAPFQARSRSGPPPAARRVPEAYWDRARDEYLAGDSGPAVCARYGIGLTTFRERARLDGWRRTDMKDSTLTSSRPVLPSDARYPDLAAEAGMRMREALARGRAADVVAWMRVQDQLAARAGPDLTARLAAFERDRSEAGSMPAIHSQLAGLLANARQAMPADAPSEMHRLLDAAQADIEAMADELAAGDPANQPETDAP